MFESLKRAAYQVPDIEKAKQWYRAILNKEPVWESPFMVIFIIGDCSLSLVLAKNLSTPGDERVVAYWEVADIDASYQRLIKLGATPRTEISMLGSVRVAKLVDPFGNIVGLTGKALEAKKQTVENQPSESARIVAFCRALAALDDREEIRGPDYLAETFLAEESRRPLKDLTSREWVIQKLVTPELYGYFIARTAYVDHIFKQALTQNAPQIVFLGAGYDTRSLRFKELLNEVRIFELDTAPTQNRKSELLRQSNVSIPEQLTFVPMNFKSDSIADVLAKAGFDKSSRTFFIWEGVTYYLPAEAVESTLDFVRSNSPSGSTICFDYMTEETPSVYAGEPFRFWIGKEKIEPFLTERGFHIIEHLATEEIEKRYLALRDGSTARAFARFGFMFAAVT